ncbi:hypothetical protein BDR22DRAFT_821579 [Usnea florida]
MRTLRLDFSGNTANVFVRIPSDDQRVAEFEGRNGGVNETASHQHKPSPTSNGHPPLTPHKTQKMNSPPTIANLPPTPDQTPTKRPLQSDPHPRSSPPLKRHRPNNAPLSPPPTSTPSPSPHHHHHHRLFHLAPKFSILHQSHPLAQPPPHGDQHSTARQKNKKKKESERAVNLSWRELERVAESVMRQVDWEKVGEDVASNRRAGVYKRAVKDVFRERIEELVGGDEEVE